MAESQETEFTKFLGSHKNYLESSAVVDYMDLSKQGKSMHEILYIIEKEKIPEYKRVIRETPMSIKRLLFSKFIQFYGTH